MTSKNKATITAKVDGFRRCGVAHSAKGREHDAEDFTPEQWQILADEPNLVVARDVAPRSDEIEGSPGDDDESESGGDDTETAKAGDDKKPAAAKAAAKTAPKETPAKG